MTGWLLQVIANACGLAAAAWLFDDISITGPDDTSRVVTLLLVALVFGVINSFVRPVVALLSLPLYVLTLGLFYFVVNALMLLLTGWISDKLDLEFHVEGFLTAVFGAIVIAIVSWAVGLLLPTAD